MNDTRSSIELVGVNYLIEEHQGPRYTTIPFAFEELRKWSEQDARDCIQANVRGTVKEILSITRQTIYVTANETTTTKDND